MSPEQQASSAELLGIPTEQREPVSVEKQMQALINEVRALRQELDTMQAMMEKNSGITDRILDLMHRQDARLEALEAKEANRSVHTVTRRPAAPAAQQVVVPATQPEDAQPAEQTAGRPLRATIAVMVTTVMARLHTPPQAAEPAEATTVAQRQIPVTITPTNMYGNNAQGGGGNFAAGMTAAERAQQPGRGRISRATRVNPDEANSQRPQRRGGRLLAVAALVGVLTLAGGAAAWLNRDGGNAQGAAPQRPQNGQVAAVDQAALRQWGINGTVGMPDDLETKQAMDAQKAHSAIMGGKLEETELSQAVNAELQLPEGSNIWREIAIQLRDKDVFDTLTLDQKEDIAAGLSNHAQDISGISDVEVRRMAIGAKYQGVDLNNPIIQARLIATADMTPEQKDNLGMLRPRSSDENVRATQSENLIKYLLTGQLPDTGNSNRRAAMRGSFGH